MAMKGEPPFETFEVNQPGDWKKIAEYLVPTVIDAEEGVEESGRDTVIVLLNGRHPVSVVLTREPEGIHLSMVGHDWQGGYVRVSNHHARAAAETILGHYTEFHEGVIHEGAIHEGAIHEVRHFYQAIQ